MLPVGTKSLLFGVHHVLLHPLLLALAWTKLYGFPTDPRVWMAFFVHDLGYWGKQNMDGAGGETHVEWGAQRMRQWFGPEWGDFCLYHSRFYARKHNALPSRLCVADKYVIVIEPWWLYLPRAALSGELWEYIDVCLAENGKYSACTGSQLFHMSLRDVWNLPHYPLLGKLLYWHARMVDDTAIWVERQRTLELNAPHTPAPAAD